MMHAGLVENWSVTKSLLSETSLTCVIDFDMAVGTFDVRVCWHYWMVFYTKHDIRLNLWLMGKILQSLIFYAGVLCNGFYYWCWSLSWLHVVNVNAVALKVYIFCHCHCQWYLFIATYQIDWSTCQNTTDYLTFFYVEVTCCLKLFVMSTCCWPARDTTSTSHLSLYWHRLRMIGSAVVLIVCRHWCG